MPKINDIYAKYRKQQTEHTFHFYPYSCLCYFLPDKGNTIQWRTISITKLLITNYRNNQRCYKEKAW